MRPGDEIPIRLQLWNGDPSRYVRARLFDSANSELAGSPVSCSHVSGGLYSGLGFIMPDTESVAVQFKVFDDAGFTIPSEDFQEALDIFQPETTDPEILSIVESIETDISILLAGGVSAVALGTEGFVETSGNITGTVGGDLGLVGEISSNEFLGEIPASGILVGEVDDETLAGETP